MSRLLQCDGNGQWWYAGKMIEPYQVEEIHELLFTRIAELESADAMIVNTCDLVARIRELEAAAQVEPGCGGQF